MNSRQTSSIRPLKCRYAPSPTGSLHLGNARTALLAYLHARAMGAAFVLRIEDIDPQRSRMEYAKLLMDDLQWLGLTWDGEPVYQSQRSDIYEHYYHLLRQQGLIYPCYCTRADLLATQAPHESDGRVVYPGTCRPTLSEGRTAKSEKGEITSEKGRAAATRLMVADEDITFTDGHYGTQTVNMARQVGDYIIRRKDGAWAYQLAVVVDDGLMGVNEVVRGRDLLLSSPQQIALAHTLGFTPPQFIHLPLLINKAGQRLSKRDSSLDIGVLRQHHAAPELIGMLAHYAGLQPEPQPIKPSQLLNIFSWDKVPHNDITVIAG